MSENKWERIGGGCGLGCDRPDHPCDDMYENTETGERVEVYSTKERHFDMPTTVEDPAELYFLDGVKPEWVEDGEAWKGS